MQYFRFFRIVFFSLEIIKFFVFRPYESAYSPTSGPTMAPKRKVTTLKLATGNSIIKEEDESAVDDVATQSDNNQKGTTVQPPIDNNPHPSNNQCLIS